MRRLQRQGALWSVQRWGFDIAGVRRCIHTPPGGFEEELPPSFGRSGAKGEISNINSLEKKKKMLRLKKSRRKLARPAAASSTQDSVVAERVRADLQKLIKKNVDFTGRRFPAEEKIHLTGDGATAGDEAFFNDRVKGYFDRTSAPQFVGREIAAGPGPSEGALTAPSEPAAGRTLLEDALADEEAVRAHDCAIRGGSLFPLQPGARAAAPGAAGSWEREQALERRFAVTPGSTVFGSDLDRLERDMLREYDQRGAALPAMDPVYSKYGAGRRGKRMLWEPSSSFDRMPSSDFARNRADEKVLGDDANRNLAAYHMSAEAYRERHAYTTATLGAATPGKTGVNLCKYLGEESVWEEGKGEGDSAPDAPAGCGTEENQPASANPHFPTEAQQQHDHQHPQAEEVPEDHEYASTRAGAEAEASRASSGQAGSGGMEGRVVVVNAQTDYHSGLTTVHGQEDSFPYDAYNQRPAEEGLVELRGVDYWNDYRNRQDIEARAQLRKDRFEVEKLTEGALDTSEVEYSTSRVRRETFLYFQNYPINEMIQESFVRIREIVPKGGGEKIVMNRVESHDLSTAQSPEERNALEKLNMDVDIPLQEARRLAQELGLDLIRVGCLNTQKSDRRVIALCQIGDHREHLRDMIKFKIQKLGVQPPPTKECIEVPFRGGTHPHAIRFKAVGIAKHLLHRHAVRVNLTKFGTPREGYPVLQSILDEVKKQCLQLKAYHRAGEIQANYDEIYCYLYPSTGRSPKTTVDHPTPQVVREACNFRVLENEKEVYFDDLHNQITQRERLAYLSKLDKGTAWAEKDEGMSMQRQRSIKVMLGYLPKGNRELYAARGDVNIPAPFRASHMTTTERWANPVESNLEQAARGAAAIGKRAAMSISEMHDSGETPENSTQLDRFYYRVQGPALEVGEFKEALGLKDNRKKRPPLDSGYATIGVGGSNAGFEHHTAVK